MDIPNYVPSPVGTTPHAPATQFSFSDRFNMMSYRDMIDENITPEALQPILPLLNMIKEILVNKQKMRSGDDVMETSPLFLVEPIFTIFFQHKPDMYEKLLIVLQPFEYDERGDIKIKDLFSQTLIGISPLLNEIFFTVMARNVPVQTYSVVSPVSPESPESPVSPESPESPLSTESIRRSEAAAQPQAAQPQAAQPQAAQPQAAQPQAAQPQYMGYMAQTHSEAQAAQAQGVQLLGVSYFVVIHGGKLSANKVAYKMDHPIRKRISYGVKYGLCPHFMEIPGVSIGANKLTTDTEYTIEMLNYISGRHSLVDNCVYDEATKSVILNPHLFTIHESDDANMKNVIGIWRFDFWSNHTFTKVCLIDWNTMNTHRLTKMWTTYMFLFNFILKDLKSIKTRHTYFNDEENANILLYCCRESSEPVLMPMLDHKTFTTFDGNQEDYYTLPTGATIFNSNNAVPFMKIIVTASINEAMNPMLTRELHMTTQGCLYNLLTYYGIFTEPEGNIMTSMQSEGVTTRQFINLMHKHDQINGLNLEQQHNYAVARVTPGVAIQYLNTVFQSIELAALLWYADVQQSEAPQPDPFTYALFIKLYPLNYKPGTEEYSELGHWVSLSYSQPHGWRYIDPQSLSYPSQHEQTVSRTHFPIKTSDERDEAFRRISSGFEAIDIIFVHSHNSNAISCSNVTCRTSFINLQTPLTTRALKGGKTRKLRLKSRPKTRPKSKRNKTRHNKYNANKHKANKRKRNKTQRKRK